MRFNLIDRIVDVQPGRSLQAVKNLTTGEEYLADHFPTFPVMPGVLMLQALVEAGSWLLRLTDNYQHSIIALREVKNVKYGTFVEPGKQLVLSVELMEQTPSLATFRGKGEVEGQTAVTARLVLARYNLGDRDAAMKDRDDRLIEHLRQSATLLLRQPAQARG